MAEDAARRIREGRFTVATVERREIRRNPVPPFTTSTLQQDASRRLGFGVRRTMQLAQTLYEGVEMGSGTVGLITYMRTGSTALADGAAEAADIDAPVVCLETHPALSVPAFDPAVHNPMGRVFEVEHRAAALGPRSLLPPGVRAHRKVAAGDRSGLARWDLLSGEDSKAFLEGAARRARKYRGALVTGTRSVNDYYANPAARAAWENSD